MDRKWIYALVAAVITFAILQFTIGTASFKPAATVALVQLNADQLRANATILAVVFGVIAGAIVLVLSNRAAKQS
jgi:ABC-type uncharacterized transport system permease subunit